MHSVLKESGESLRTVIGVRPMLMLTGFLGAGKTTLLRAILDDLASREHLADVILNDRENARLDRETLQDHAASVAALTGSCVCCDGLDELCAMILKAAKSTHSVLLIELNGTADPLPLQESFTLLESKFLLHPRWQVCVIDARYFGKRGHYDELEKLQLETASHFVISHEAEMSEARETALIQLVKEINSQASRATSGTLAEALSEAIRKNRRHTLARSQHGEDVTSLPSLSSPVVEKPHLHDRHQLAHEFTGCNIVFPSPVDEEAVRLWMKELPVSVIRAKALVTLTSDLDCRFLFERVGEKVSPHAIPVRQISKIPCSGLFIGPDLEPDEILRQTREILHPDCHFPKP